ncbi:MAG: transposase [Betaproteobacteria bacterium]
MVGSPAMPRRPRLHLDEIPLHIVQRGHNRKPCFFSDTDRSSYLHWLGDAIQENECRLHAYVLMTNHVHLLLTPRRAASISPLIMSLGRHYVQHFNRVHDRTGTLWDSRYKSSLVDTDGHLLACYRYIELNPVRAGLVKDPGHYQWSSYRANGLGHPDSRLTPHPHFLALGTNDHKRQEAYRAMFAPPVAESMTDEIRMALNQCQPLGGERFQLRIEQVTGIRREARPRGRPSSRRGAADAQVQSLQSNIKEFDPDPFSKEFDPDPIL